MENGVYNDDNSQSCLIMAQFHANYDLNSYWTTMSNKRRKKREKYNIMNHNFFFRLFLTIKSVDGYF